jgi:hypothetical protein
MKIRVVFLTLGLLLSAPACDTEVSEGGSGDTDGASNSGGSGDAPSSGAVSSCRGACDNLQFFDCINADTHETCWNACPNRSDGDLELFSSCVMNSLPSCDPGCLDNLLDAPEPDPDPDPTGSDTGGDNACEEACQAYVDADCDLSDLGEVPSCGLLCAQLTENEQAVVAACLNAPQTCEVNPACLDGEGEGSGGEEGGGFDESGGDSSSSCQFACDDLLFYACIAPAEHSNCYSVCGSAPTGDVDAFVGCVNSVGATCDGTCYDVFAG